MMVRSLVQFAQGEQRGVAALDETGAARVVAGATTTLALAGQALGTGQSLSALASAGRGRASTSPPSPCSRRSTMPTLRTCW
jgi:hypothetical protein